MHNIFYFFKSDGIKTHMRHFWKWYAGCNFTVCRPAAGRGQSYQLQLQKHICFNFLPIDLSICLSILSSFLCIGSLQRLDTPLLLLLLLLLLLARLQLPPLQSLQLPLVLIVAPTVIACFCGYWLYWLYYDCCCWSCRCATAISATAVTAASTTTVAADAAVAVAAYCYCYCYYCYYYYC